MAKINQIVMEVCYRCGNGFILGGGGIYQESDTEVDVYNPICDECAGIERDCDGNYWLPNVTQIVWADGTVTTRAEAFAK